MKNVDWKEDMVEFMPVMIGEYEKANIWPEFSTFDEFANVLDEEINEACDKCKELYDRYEVLYEIFMNSKILNRKTKTMINEVKGHAFGTICELLQVIAVCNKMLKD